MRLTIKSTATNSFIISTILTIVAAVSVVFFPVPASATRFTPISWQQRVESGPLAGQRKLINWIRDTNNNFVDDDIDALPPTELVDIVVDLNRCLSESEINTEFSSFGNIQYIGKFVASVAIGEVTASDVYVIAERPDVAMVELQSTFSTDLDVGPRTVRAISSTTFSPDTVEDLGVTGAGVNIAILDSGVDNGHETFRDKFVAGFDVFTQTEGDPDDDLEPEHEYHGTHVAGIALGAGFAGSVPTTCRGADDGSPDRCIGVAPGAGLVDIKVLKKGVAPKPNILQLGVDIAIQHQTDWGIGVMNMSWSAKKGPTDGQDSLCQAVNTAVARGIVAVVAAGNDGPDNLGFTAPSAASLAITVANARDRRSVARDDTTIRDTSNRGPRAGDNDGDPSDEYKPDIAAPGTGIVSSLGDMGAGESNRYDSKTGTSMAAPHIAGIAALILDANPRINPGSVKELMKLTAERYPTIPGMETSNPPLQDSVDDPNYDIGSGFGLVDAFAAVTAAAITDVKFPSCINGNGGGNPCLLSPDNSDPPDWLNTADIRLADEPPVDSTPNEIRARVSNDGTNPAQGVRVNFGVYKFTAGTKRFFEKGSRVVDIPAGDTVTVSVPWTPDVSPSKPDLGHRCIQVTIDYGVDSDFTNNLTQRNVDVKNTSSSAVFTFDVENPLTVPVTIELETFTKDPGWTCALQEDSFPLDPFSDCAKAVVATVDPVPQGIPRPPEPNGRVLLGGVSLEAIDAVEGSAICHVYAFAKRCDIDTDGSVDRDDIREIFNARNTSATYGDPRDPNGDGVIDVNDARRCVLQCDNPRCAP